MSTDSKFMRMALQEAAKGRGHVEPNPQVGAVIVKNGVVKACGHHKRFGGPHAEVEAITAAEAESSASTLYVNLEPCAHHGKTPPCVDAILEAGITKVVTAMRDPNPLTCGKGNKNLQDAGVKVVEGVLQGQAQRLNAPYIKLTTQGVPYVTAKWAMTLDGKIATVRGQSKWISCEESRRKVHELRGHMDAVLVGVGTVLADDPLLTARGLGPRTPARIVADSRASTPVSSRLLNTLDDGEVLVAVASDAPKDKVEGLTRAGAEVLMTPSCGKTDLAGLLKLLGERQMTNVLVEGGGTILGALFEGGLVDAAKVFVAPKIFAGRGAPGPTGGEGIRLVEEALRCEELTVEKVGEDLLIHALIGANKSGSPTAQT